MSNSNFVLMEMQGEFAANSPYIDSRYTEPQILTKVPYGNINKTIPGCGLTTLALESNESVIILVPSKELVRNKQIQYPNEKCPYNVLGVIGDQTKQDVDDYIANNLDQPIKILVTNDSLWKVEHLLNTVHVIVDESNQLLSDAELKSRSKKNLYSEDILSHLYNTLEQYKDRLSFITATPTPLQYLPEWISELPQIKMTWRDTTKVRPTLMKRGYPYKALKNEVLNLMNKNGFVRYGDLVIKKAIIFINSIYNVVKMLEELEIPTEEVGFIVGDTANNDAILGEYTRINDYFNLPKYTFVTSSGFAGIDLKDKEAVNIVVSNVNKEWRMLDIITDVRQAVARQRDRTNPFFDQFLFLYNNNVFEMTEEELINRLKYKKEFILKKIRSFELLKNEDLQDVAEDWGTNDPDFLAYTNYNRETNTFQFNDNLFNADVYFVKVIRKQYTEGFDIKGEFKEIGSVIDESGFFKFRTPEYRNLCSHLSKQLKANPKLDIEFVDWAQYSTRTTWIDTIVIAYKLYGKVFYEYEEAKEMIKVYSNKREQLRIQVLSLFNIGARYSRSEVKSKLNDVYNELNIKRTAKHSDIMEFYNVKEIKVMGERMLDIISIINRNA